MSSSQSDAGACKHCGKPLCDSDLGRVCRACMMCEALDTGGDDLDVDTAMPEPDGVAPDAGRSLAPDPLEGSQLGPDGRYKILQRLGEGGFGVVYMAEQTAPVKRRVALKVLKAGMDTRQIIARFEAERQALAMMDHPNIAKVLDGGETEHGRPFFVMELVRGTPITAFCDREELSTRQRLDLFLQVCHAVQHAHQKGIIHRDLKPGNILVTMPDGAEPVPKVIDFGVAKAMESSLTDKTLFTRFEQMIGTPAYMSPEQAGSEGGTDLDTRADIYALGVLLYELLTGTTPFESTTLQHAAFDEVRRILREEEAPRPSARLGSLEAERRTTIARERGTEAGGLGKLLRGDLDWIVMKAIEKDRRRRYDTANALADDVVRHLEDEPVSAGPPTAAYRTRKFLRRHKATVGVAAAMVVLLLAGIGATSWQAIRATEEQRRNAAERDRAVEAEALAEERLQEAEAISEFITGMFESAEPGAEDGGRTIMVVDALNIAAKKVEEDEEIPPERRAILQKSIGGVYYSLGRYNDAIALFQQVCQYYQDTYGLEHSDTLKALHALAMIYRTVGRGEEAMEMQEKVLELSGKIHGVQDLFTIKAMHNLANTYGNVGRREKALEIHEEVVSQLNALGAESSERAIALSSLANSYSDAGRRDEALEMREEALAFCRGTLNPEHPHNGLAMLSLSNSYADAGRHEEALQLREKALEHSRKVLGSEAPLTLDAMYNLSGSYVQAGRAEEALAIREELADLRRKVDGPKHPRTLVAMIVLANSCRTAGRGEEALKMREETLELCRTVLGVEHPNTVMTMQSLSNSYADAGRSNEALALREKVLAMRRKVLGSEHVDTAEAMNLLSISYSETGRQEEALELRAEALKVNGRKSEATHQLLNALGNRYHHLGRNEEALEVRLEQFKLSRELYGEEHAETRRAEWLLANAYEVVGQLNEAAKLRGPGHLPLKVDSPKQVAVLIPATSAWKWFHPVDGVDPSQADADFHRTFYQSDFDDSAWSEGTDGKGQHGGFGYGDEWFTGVDIGLPAEKGLSKAAYFRHRFTTDEPFGNLELRCQRDDGIVVYLDGKEVARGNMSEGEERFELAAESSVGSVAETAVFRLPLEGVTLPPGDHLLAISLHNTAAPSSDLRIGEISLVEVEESEADAEAPDQD